MSKWINLMVGGVLGTLARYVLSGTIYQMSGSGFPYGTLIVNLIGCFAVGFLAALAEEKFCLALTRAFF